MANPQTKRIIRRDQAGRAALALAGLLLPLHSADEKAVGSHPADGQIMRGRQVAVANYSHYC